MKQSKQVFWSEIFWEQQLKSLILSINYLQQPWQNNVRSNWIWRFEEQLVIWTKSMNQLNI